MLLSGLTIKHSKIKDKLLSIREMQIELTKDKHEFKNQLGKKGLEFINRELSKLEMDACFLSLKGNEEAMFKYFA